jgi:outer membrane protein assembly factor BamE (lipoprotein component of BamABCDE complex)
MKSKREMKCLLIAMGLALGAAAASAQSGYWVNKNQEMLVKPGMTKTEVQQALGRPSRDARYGAAPGSTWIYHVSGTAIPEAANRTLYEVDFDAEGKVISAGERVVEREYSAGY